MGQRRIGYMLVAFLIQESFNDQSRDEIQKFHIKAKHIHQV